MPADRLRLDRAQVDVWRAAVDLPPETTRRLFWALSPEERDRARHLHLRRDRGRYVVRRFALRSILARYTGAQPESLRFRSEAGGKPTLAVPSGPRAIRFSVSRSGGLAVYSVAQGRETGIDIEWMGSGLAAPAAERFLLHADRAVLHTVPRELYERAFLACWTRMEAYVKGIGEGLAGVSGVAPEAAGWVVSELVAAPGYMGAIAVKGVDWTLRFWEWRPGD
jgi:4'-phosphopantetheinyl transferase